MDPPLVLYSQGCIWLTSDFMYQIYVSTANTFREVTPRLNRFQLCFQPVLLQCPRTRYHKPSIPSLSLHYIVFFVKSALYGSSFPLQGLYLYRNFTMDWSSVMPMRSFFYGKYKGDFMMLLPNKDIIFCVSGIGKVIPWWSETLSLRAQKKEKKRINDGVVLKWSISLFDRHLSMFVTVITGIILKKCDF